MSVLGLEEIGDSPADKNVMGCLDRSAIKNDSLSTAFDALNARGLARWEYFVAPNRPDVPFKELNHTGIAWDSRKVEVLGLPRAILDIPDPPPALIANNKLRYPWPHPPVIARFRSKLSGRPFTVVIVHMKSEPDNRDVREFEAKTLMDALKTIIASTPNEELVIMGDTNIDDRNENAVKILTGDQQLPLSLLNSEDTITTYIRSPGDIGMDNGVYECAETRSQWTLDRIFVSRHLSTLAGRAFHAVKEDYLIHSGINFNGFRRLYSDHFMVRTEI